MMREARSTCRICTAFCATRVKIDDDGAIVSIHGDRENPVHRGYACYKGTHVHEAMRSPGRLLHPLARGADGALHRIGTEKAMDEIADRLATVIAKHGPEAVGMFVGNGGFPHSATGQLRWAFLDAIGSDARFTSATIDVGAQFMLAERMGYWAGGKQQLADADVGLIFGSNPLVSHQTSGIVDVDPVKRLKNAKARGYKLIVVDPRCTETARQADLFVQPYPGQDAAIAAGVLHVILAEGWHDETFCKDHVGDPGMAALKAAVAPFTPELAAARAGITPAEIRAIARMFARDGHRGIAFAMTGINLGADSNLAAHMVECLNVVCGRFRRAGESYQDFNPMLPDVPRHAEVVPPSRWAQQQRSRIRGFGLAGERNSGTLAAEILEPGKGQIKALFAMGGNPANSVPDQRRIVDALRSLELLVVLDPFMSNTARLGHYVLPPRMMYERADVSLGLYGGNHFPRPMAQYTPPLVDPPAGSELVDDWYMMWSVARRLGLALNCGDAPLEMANPPAEDELFRRIMARATVDFARLKATDGPLILEEGGTRVVQPPRAEAQGARFDLMPRDIAAELAAVQARAMDAGHPGGAGFSHLLIGRRLPRLYNTQGGHPDRGNPMPRNRAYLHPDDYAALSLSQGDFVTICSARDFIRTEAEPDPTVRRGTVAVSHGWGGLPEDDHGEGALGASVNRLVSDKEDLQEVNSMPRMTAVPVTVTRYGPPLEATARSADALTDHAPL